MSTDPFSCRTPALRAMALAIAAQLANTEAAVPWLAQADADPALLGARIVNAEAALAQQVALLGVIDDAAPVPYLQAAPVLEAVAGWRSGLLFRLRACAPRSPAGRAAAEVRKLTRVNPLRLEGTVGMLDRVLPRLLDLQAAFPASVRPAEAVAEGEGLLAALKSCLSAVRARADERERVAAAYEADKATLLVAMREARRCWAEANRLSSGALPALNVAYGLADLAVTRGSRGPKKRG